jgi:hypothetical protein
MNIEAVGKLIEENKGLNLFKTYIPTLEKEFSFKQMMVGQLKSFSKLSISEDDMLEYGISQLGVLRETCTEELNTQKLADIDFLSLLISFRINNITEPITLQMKCKCGSEFKYIVPLTKIEEQLKKISIADKVFEKEVNNIKYKFVVNHPLYINAILYEQLINDIKEDEEISDLVTEKEKLILFPIPYIKEIYINDELIDDYSEMSFEQKVESNFFNKLPGKLFEDKNNLITFIMENINKAKFDALSQKVACPKCKDITEEGVVDYQSFFIL